MLQELPVEYMGEIAKLPSKGDAGTDLAISEDTTILPGLDKLIGTGLWVAIPENTVGLIIPRSSTGKLNIMLANTVGVIDSGYRGELRLFIKNLDSNEAILLKKGQRIAQLVIVPFITPIFKKVDKLEETERNTKGFGSTGA